MHHFIVPQYIPKSLNELPPEPDEVTSLVYLEDSIAKEVSMTDFFLVFYCAANLSPTFTRIHCSILNQKLNLTLPIRPLNLQLTSIREYHKDARPVGQVAHQEDNLSEPEEEANGGSTPGSDEQSSDFQDDDGNGNLDEEEGADGEEDVEMI